MPQRASSLLAHTCVCLEHVHLTCKLASLVAEKMELILACAVRMSDFDQAATPAEVNGEGPKQLAGTPECTPRLDGHHWDRWPAS